MHCWRIICTGHLFNIIRKEPKNRNILRGKVTLTLLICLCISACAGYDFDDDSNADEKIGILHRAVEIAECTDGKEVVCHVPANHANGGLITICVASAAVPAHLAHGDSMGACDDGSNELVCGAGTIEVNGECIPDNPVFCGAGTIEVDGECIPETLDCAPGESTICQCVPEVPVEEEICDYVDNDGDGETDELFPLVNTACFEGLGSCRNEGVWVCNNNGTGVQCSAVPGSPTEEVCNGEDDDCDGLTDETCGNESPGYCEVCTNDEDCEEAGINARCILVGNKTVCLVGCSQDEPCSENSSECTVFFDGSMLCVPQSNDCDCRSISDEGKIRTCILSNSFGTCTGIEICDPSLGFIGCDAQSPATEICNGMDDDCDNETDEGCTPL